MDCSESVPPYRRDVRVLDSDVYLTDSYGDRGKEEDAEYEH